MRQPATEGGSNQRTSPPHMTEGGERSGARICGTPDPPRERIPLRRWSVVTAIAARTLRGLGCLAVSAAFVGCQADPASLAHIDATANRPSVLQLVSAEEPADQPQSVTPKPAVHLDRDALDRQLPEAATGLPPLPNQSAVLLDPPQSLLSKDGAAAEPGAAADGPQLTSVAAYLEVARLAQQKGLPALAEKYYFKAVHAYPNAAVAWNDLGQFYATQKEYPKGVHAVQMAVRLEPASRRYHNNLGTLLVRAGRLDEGIKEFEIAVGLAAAHYNAGVVLHEMGNHRESVRQFQLALEKDPNLREAQLALKRLAPKVAIASRRNASASAAVRNHRAAVRNHPVAPRVRLSRSTPRGLGAHTETGEQTFTQRLRKLFRWPTSRKGENEHEVTKTAAAKPRSRFFGFLRPDRKE